MSSSAIVIACVIGIVVGSVLSRLLEAWAAARCAGVLTEVQSTEPETIATWTKARLRRATKLVKRRRTELEIEERRHGHPLFGSPYIDRELERAKAAEQKLRDATLVTA